MNRKVGRGHSPGLLVGWILGLVMGTGGMGGIYSALTTAHWAGLPVAAGLFLVGLYISGTVVARARAAYREQQAQSGAHRG